MTRVDKKQGPSPAAAAGYRPQPGGSPGGRTGREDVARTEVASGEAGSVPERPGLGGGPARARDPPREHPRVGGPGPPPTGAERRPDFSPTSHTRPPPSTIWKSTASESDTSKIPRPLRPPSPSWAAFLPRRFREGERIPRTKSAGKAREGEGGGRAREPLPRFFFSPIKKESTRFFPSSKPWPAVWMSRGPETSKTRPQSAGRHPPHRAPCSRGAQISAGRSSTLAASFPREARRSRSAPGQARTLADSASGRGFPARRERRQRLGIPVPSRLPLLHPLPSLGLKRGAPGAPHTGSPTPPQPTAPRIPAAPSLLPPPPPSPPPISTSSGRRRRSNNYQEG